MGCPCGAHIPAHLDTVGTQMGPIYFASWVMINSQLAKYMGPIWVPTVSKWAGIWAPHGQLRSPPLFTYGARLAHVGPIRATRCLGNRSGYYDYTFNIPVNLSMLFVSEGVLV